MRKIHNQPVIFTPRAESSAKAAGFPILNLEFLASEIHIYDSKADFTGLEY